LRRDRLVACLRKDNPLATKAAIQPSDLQDNLAILYHPQRHPDAHTRLLELLSDAGVSVKEYSRASHPSEMRTLVKDGYGFALIREGTLLEDDLTTRPILGVDWTVDTAVIYHKQRHPKTVPILVRKLKQNIQKDLNRDNASAMVRTANGFDKRPPQSVQESPVQLSFYNETH
jgi:DNA-binding transcriptional LysR family regulator